MPVPNSADHQRIYRLYHYICACLAMKQKPDGTPYFTAISAQLTDNTEFRRVISSLFQEGDIHREAGTAIAKLGKVTTGSVVSTLIKLCSSLQADYLQHEELYNRVLTPEDILTVLYRLIDLTPQEREALHLPSNDGLTLLQQALLTLQTAGGIENYEMIFQIYKAAVGLDFTQAEPSLEDLDQVDELIKKTVQASLAYLPNRTSRRTKETTSPGKDDTVRELTQKAQREIRRLLARSGNQQSPVVGNTLVNSYIQHYLQPAFVRKLSQTVVANERLTDQFPVYLKRITIEACGPLPFADKELGVLHGEGPYPALLHPALKRIDQKTELDRVETLPDPGDYELASQEATKVTAEFYVKVPPGYEVAVERMFHQLASEDRRRMDFALSSTGIGGALSHVIKVINTALLNDIACLKDYFSIAHDVTSTQEIIRDNVPSPVWAHSLVKLCHKRTVGQTIEACSHENLRSYEEFAFAEPIGHGDYCGFDFLSSQAQAALQARLQAIRNTGVIPQDYIRHLCRRTEYLKALESAWSYLQGYPFSSMAMIGVIDKEILGPNVGDRPLTKADPYIYFDACLSITEVLLDEGCYRLARQYLERLSVIDEFVQQGLAVAQPPVNSHSSNFEVFSGTLVVRYLLCLAHYYYLYDTSDRDNRYLPPGCSRDINREGLIQRAWQALDQAQQHISVRLRKYVVINEVSQGTFHPHYHLLARIVFLRAKLLVFFPRHVPKEERYLPTDRFLGQLRTEASTHWGRLYLSEKARLYAAADGSSDLYACFASMQCWFHLMAAYADSDNLTLPPSPTSRSLHSQTLDRRHCLKWAKQLRDHALISYADTGRRCYYQIKEKSGLPNETDEFGLYRIQKIPAIYEARGSEYSRLINADRDALVFDLTLLAVNPVNLPKISPDHPTQTIYLFGTNACYLFFARGLYLLCSDTSQEFEADDVPAAAIQWDGKLEQAMRLLNMAWAIAEEGGEIHKTEGMILHITRSLSSTDRSDEYTSPDVKSVRDLYPRRITEIADLGKIFAATCMVLRLNTTTGHAREVLYEDIKKLLNALYSAHRLSPTLRALLARQARYNGHLNTYLSRAKSILLHHAELTRMQPDSAPLQVGDRRNQLLKELFSMPFSY